MKIRLFSDLHLEFAKNRWDHFFVPRGDDFETTLLLAGDISTGLSSVPFIEAMCSRFKYVLMIPGNHEYYHYEFEKVNNDFLNWELEESPKNFHFLYNDFRVLDGVRFLGGTMWTDFEHEDPLIMADASVTMNDYGMIRLNGLAMTPEYILNEHKKFTAFLQAKFDESFTGPTVVMSHHSPGNSLRRRGRRVRDDAFYFANIEYYVGNEDKAVLWVHGHTHRNWDYKINNTRVVCNPYGYSAIAENHGFDPEIVIEV